MTVFVDYLTALLGICVLTGCTEARCSSNRDCKSCVSSKTWFWVPCRWCPLDSSCHSKWSPRNHCLTVSHDSLGDKTQCLAYESENFEYDEDEAYKLALFSAIVYSDVPDQCLTALFPDSDYTISATYLRECDNFFLDYDKKCLAIVAYSHRNKEIIVAYRGTRGFEQLLDQVLVTLAIPSLPTHIGGKVQIYFHNVHKTFYQSIRYLIQDLKQWFPSYKVKITGHSLGGAAASITSAMLVKDKVLQPEDVALYTFGMPRVGNKQYALAHDKLVPNSWRIVRRGDLVARLPSCSFVTCSVFKGPYHHGTKVMYTGSKMEKGSDYVVCKGNEDSLKKCRDNQRKKRSIFASVMDKHRQYFNLPIGTYCRDHVLKD